MLDDFAPELPVVRVEPKPAELVGFVSEHISAPEIDVSTTTPRNWREAASPVALMSAGWICAALTIGAVALPAQSPVAHRAVRVTRSLPVFVATTPLLSARASAPAKSRTAAPRNNAALRTQPAGRAARRSPVEKRTAIAQMPAPTVRAIPASPLLNTNTVIVSSPPPAPMLVAATAARSQQDETAVRAVLDMYRGAYEQLDARAARRVWPTVDERRLARAFSDLQSQTLNFEECRIAVEGARGVARCRGQATYVGRVGTRAPQTQDRSWTFQLQKTAERWAINSVRSE
jgi:hypothetical protein